MEADIAFFCDVARVIEDKIGVVLCFVIVLPQQEVIAVHLVLIMGCCVLFQWKASCLVVKHYELLSFYQYVVYCPFQRVSSAISVSYALEIAPPLLEEICIVKQLHLPIQLFELRRKAFAYERVKMLLEDHVHA